MSSLAERALRWADGAWDDQRALLWNPPGSFDDDGLPPWSAHMVPQSAWYAVGLLVRGDVDRAARVLEALCDLQYDEPGAVWHGTFARFAEWPAPPLAGAVEWVDYDPNWRQFLGTTFAVVLRSFDLPVAVESRLRSAIDLAIAGEPPDRVSPQYSNIALMRAWLEEDEGFAAAVVDSYDEHGAFDEYNSPTYYGIDLYAISLWRTFPPSPRFASWGDELWSALWHDIARWWHPGLRNLCGPYSRSYGMDMTRYVALLGLWLPTPVVPALDAPFEHSHDVTMAPLISLVRQGDRADVAGATLSDDERLVEQRLHGGRVATGWLAPGVMVGAERGASYRAEGQYHPATAQWSLEDGSVGWLRLRHAAPLSATATPGTLTVVVHDHHREGPRPVWIESSHPGGFGSGDWSFPERRIGYEGPPVDARGVIAANEGDVLELRFSS